MFSRKSTTRTGRDSLNCRRVGIEWPIIIIMTLCPYKNTDYFHFKDEQLQLMETRTCRDTRGRSRGRSRDPDRWPLLWTGTAHTAASPTGRRPQLHYGTSGGREGETERHNKTHTNRRTENRVERWTLILRFKLKRVLFLFLDSWICQIQFVFSTFTLY